MTHTLEFKKGRPRFADLKYGCAIICKLGSGNVDDWQLLSRYLTRSIKQTKDEKSLARIVEDTIQWAYLPEDVT